jgi:DNA-binding NarL/FixJ family response regulator
MRQQSLSRAHRPPEGLSVVVSLDDRPERQTVEAAPPLEDRCSGDCGLAKEVGEAVLEAVSRYALEAGNSDILAGVLRGLHTSAVSSSRPDLTPSLPPLPTESAAIRVLVVDDHELIRQGLKRLLESTHVYEVVGEVGTVAETNEVLNRAMPDLVFVDTLLPDGSGMTVVSEIRKRSPKVGIVVMATANTDEQLIGALEAGASSLVAKSADSSELLAAAAQAVRMPEVFTAKHFAEVMKRRSHGAGPRLSSREREVLILLAEGLSAPAIANRLFVAESTVKGNMAKLYAKLDSTNRAQAIMAGIRYGFIWP